MDRTGCVVKTSAIERQKMPQKRRREFFEEFGEDVLACKLVRDNILRMGRFDPLNIQHMRSVLTLTTLRLSSGERVLSHEDLREVFFKEICGFDDDDFLEKPGQTLARGSAIDLIRTFTYQFPYEYFGVTVLRAVVAAPPPDDFFGRDLWTPYWYSFYVPRVVISTIVQGCFVERVLRAPTLDSSFLRDKFVCEGLLKWGIGAGIDDIIFKLRSKGFKLHMSHVKTVLVNTKHKDTETIFNMLRSYLETNWDEQEYQEAKQKYLQLQETQAWHIWSKNL